MLECPHFDDIRARFPDLLQDARDFMRNLMWHQKQKALSDFVIAILDDISSDESLQQGRNRSRELNFSP